VLGLSRWKVGKLLLRELHLDILLFSNCRKLWFLLRRGVFNDFRLVIDDFFNSAVSDLLIGIVRSLLLDGSVEVFLSPDVFVVRLFILFPHLLG